MAERAQTVTSELKQTPAGEYSRAGSANRLPLKARLAAIALTAPGMAVLLAACGGDDAGDKTFTTEQLTQTAEAGLPKTVTLEGTKIVVVENTPIPTPTKTPEPIPTPTPERVYSSEEAEVLIIEAVDTVNIPDQNRVSMIKNGAKNIPLLALKNDPNLIRSANNSFGDLAKMLIGVACDNPGNQEVPQAYFAWKSVYLQFIDKQISAGMLTESQKQNGLKFSFAPLTVRPDCKNKYLVPPSK